MISIAQINITKKTRRLVRVCASHIKFPYHGKKRKTAGRLSENSRKRFVDRQSKKTVKKTDQKKSSFY